MVMVQLGVSLVLVQLSACGQEVVTVGIVFEIEPFAGQVAGVVFGVGANVKACGHRVRLMSLYAVGSLPIAPHARQGGRDQNQSMFAPLTP